MPRSPPQLPGQSLALSQPGSPSSEVGTAPSSMFWHIGDSGQTQPPAGAFQHLRAAGGHTCLAVIPTQPPCPSSEGNLDFTALRGSQCSPPPFLEHHLYHSLLAWVNISSQSLPTKKEGLAAASTPHSFAPAPSRSPWRLPCSQV